MVGDDNANTNPNDAVWNAARHAFSLAARRPESGVFTLVFYLTTDIGNKAIAYDSWHTSNSSGGSGWVYGMGNEPLGSGSASDWMTISRDIEADIQSIDSARTVTNIDGFRLSRNDLKLDDIVLADARTTRVYTLAPSALGGIISIRDVADDFTNTDSWYHYDRMGNVALTSDDTGASSGLRWQDAYGNQLASVTDGSWASAAAANGYGLTTKEFDGDVELYYFWQRWNSPSQASFLSRDQISSANPYEFAFSAPLNVVDVDGRQGVYVPGKGPGEQCRACFRKCMGRRHGGPWPHQSNVNACRNKCVREGHCPPNPDPILFPRPQQPCPGPSSPSPSPAPPSDPPDCSDACDFMEVTGQVFDIDSTYGPPRTEQDCILAAIRQSADPKWMDRYEQCAECAECYGYDTGGWLIKSAIEAGETADEIDELLDIVRPW
jgi:RHS repeat-associated protein